MVLVLAEIYRFDILTISENGINVFILTNSKNQSMHAKSCFELKFCNKGSLD